MDRLSELKNKYGPVLESMPQHGVQIINVELRDNKLLVQGIVPTQEAKNAVWNQIKAIDSTYADLTCDLRQQSEAEEWEALQKAPPQSLASGLAAAFRSDQTPAFPSMLSNLFGNSDPQQRAGLLNHLLASAGPGLLGAALPGGLGGLLKGGSTITPEQAQQISPQAIQSMAEHAEKSNPSIIDQVSNFYSQHPKTIQALGVGAMAMIMSNMTKRS
ncbi:MAG: hypothetical protein JO182_31075 [Acidobacteriaceae bacterium]|nr:hypothetical protein [Acidobacteriaceae bacterium]